MARAYTLVGIATTAARKKKEKKMKNYLVSHNARSVTINGEVFHFRLYRSRNASRFWFGVISSGRSFTYDSLPTDLVSICLSNLSRFVHFLGGKFDCTGYVDAVDMLQDYFSDVVFAEGIIK